VAAGLVSAAVSWVGALHREARESERRREQFRREQLRVAVVDFLAADQKRVDVADEFRFTDPRERGGTVDPPSRDSLVKAYEGVHDARADSRNALARIRLYSAAVHSVAEEAHASWMGTAISPRDARWAEMRAWREELMERLVEVAREELFGADA
jgi:hypothetical protein